MDESNMLQKFREQAAGMGDHPTYGDLIGQLARLLAESRGRLSKENFEVLVDVGGALYKAGLSQYQARADVAEVMRKSGAESGPRAE